jgi:hypothetical protein
LFANGRRIEAIEIPADASVARGVKYVADWNLPRPRHDVHLVAIATGPGVEHVYWKTAKPYQPLSPDWTPRVLACSGAVRVDGDGDGRWQAPREVAWELVARSGRDLEKLGALLGDYDTAVATQAAAICQEQGINLLSESAQTALALALPFVREAFGSYIEAWKAGVGR